MNIEQSKGVYVSDGGPGGVAGGNNEHKKPASSEAVEAARDALQTDVISIIEKASEYAETHHRDKGGKMGLQQIELTVPGESEKKEKIVIGYFKDDPKASQLVTQVRPLSFFQLPAISDVAEAMAYGFTATGEEIVDYTLLAGEKDIKREVTKFAFYPWEHPKAETFGHQSGVASEGDIQRLQEKIAKSTVTGRKVNPNISVATLLQKDIPPSSSRPTQ